ncbi:hypothetical protein LPTSP4_24860 [Leptospira ryugenii]|uniref:Tetratricopeptide repeat protein n=1 Tax=Leptospira ryugenii TaxID=1917863 RepID=A0A2P2E230_9LEPT|nr:hypothetical protein [Leptospira ryugenii]GBF50955.1 hypothetical protein LPTSP4_24860 [Leptospira ryugenii]
MDIKVRAQLIREGNQAFNAGDIRKARELFLKTGYQDGLIRLGDHFMYERKLPMLAFGYYKKAGRQDKVDEIFQRMLMALSEWLGKDKVQLEMKPPGPSKAPANSEVPTQELNPDDFRVHPILRAKALQILGRSE